MKRCVSIFFVFTILASAGLVLAEVHVDTFHSPTLDRTRSMQVHLPANYDPELEGGYPVVYFLHGMNGSYNSSWYQFVHGILDDLIEQSLIEPMIMVKPDGSTGFLSGEGRVDFGGSNWRNSDLYGAFEDYLVYDVPEYIEMTYNASPLASKRAIMGHSMGGYGAMNAAISHHDRYRAVASHCGYPDLENLVDWVPWILNENGSSPPYNYDPTSGSFSQGFFLMAGSCSPNLSNPPYFVDFPLDENGELISSIFDDQWVPSDCSTAAALVPINTPLRIYFDCGTSDDFGFHSFNTAFVTVLDALGFVGDSDWIPGDAIDGEYVFWSFPGNHFSHIGQQVTRSLRFIDTAFAEGSLAAEPMPEMNRLELSVHPNPFNPQTTIKFSLERDEWASVYVYELAGKRVANLANQVFTGGEHSVLWNGRDLAGRSVPSGTYFVRVETKSAELVQKLMLIR